MKKNDEKISEQIKQQRAKSKEYALKNEKALIARANQKLYGIESLRGQGSVVFNMTYEYLGRHSVLFRSSVKNFVWNVLKYKILSHIGNEIKRAQRHQEIINDKERNPQDRDEEKRIMDRDIIAQIDKLVGQHLKPREIELYQFIKKQYEPKFVAEYYGITPNEARVSMFRVRVKIRMLCKKHLGIEHYP